MRLSTRSRLRRDGIDGDTTTRGETSHCPRRARRRRSNDDANTLHRDARRTPPARTATRPSPMPRGARCASRMTHSSTCGGAAPTSRRRPYPQRRDPKALPGRALATLAALDVKGASPPLPARDAVVDGNHAAATARDAGTAAPSSRLTRRRGRSCSVVKASSSWDAAPRRCRASRPRFSARL